MAHHGITIPFDDLTLAEHRERLAELADLGYTDVWSMETAGADAFTPLALASTWAPSLRLGTAIVPVFTRGPAVIAMSAAALAEAAPGRFLLGVGSSSDVIVERWNGVELTEPYKRVRDTVRFLRAALTGEKVTAQYDTFSINGFRLERVPAERPRILVAALRPGMLRMAGREADGAIINWLSADDVRTVVPHVHEGGPGKEIVARVFVCPSSDTEAARALGRRMIAAYLNVPVYRAFHEWLGRTELLQPMWDAWSAGDRKGALAAIPDQVVDDIIIHGTPEECRAHIQRYVDAGVTTTAPHIVRLPGTDVGQAVHDLAPAAG